MCPKATMVAVQEQAVRGLMACVIVTSSATTSETAALIFWKSDAIPVS